MSTTMMALRANSEAATAEQKRATEKRRNILVLIHQHLIENGYVEAAERLQHEAGSVISKFEVADNVDFGLILGEYEAYYEMRFDKKPKLVRKLQDGEVGSRAVAGRLNRQSESSGVSRKPTKEKITPPGNGKLPTVAGATPSNADDDVIGSIGLGVSGISMGGSSADNSHGKQKKTDADSTDRDRFEER